MRRGLLATGAVLLALLVAGMLYLQNTKPELSSQVLLYPQAKPLPAFQMTDNKGERFDNQRLVGRWSLLLIGYTFCPDVCPTTLAMLSGVHAEISAAIGEELQVVFISADPERDSQQRLDQYVSYFSTRFTAAFAPHAQLYPLVSTMGLVYARHERETSDYYLVDHSASIVLVNPQGQMHALFRPQANEYGVYTVSATTLSHDLPLIVDEYAG